MASDASDLILYSVEDGIATLTLNRPERMNGLTRRMSDLFGERLDTAAADRDVRAVIVTGAGRAFCAGSDVEDLADLSAGTAGEKEDEAEPFRRRAFEIPKPTIAAINGACAGAGLAIALECDVRFAAAGAKLTTSFARRGLVAERGISWLLPRIVGLSRALDLLMSARVILPEEAERCRLVDGVTAPDQLIPTARAYARELIRWSSPNSMAAIKWQVYRHAGADLPTTLTETKALVQASLKHSEFGEGIASFMERREPRFAPVGKIPGGWPYPDRTDEAKGPR
jgi:enoyl-CoA hydratase/carnithine racemase